MNMIIIDATVVSYRIVKMITIEFMMIIVVIRGSIMLTTTTATGSETS